VIAREGRIPLDKAGLYFREIGQGLPIIVLHGGPDFDHGYFLPDLDRLADAFRLIYYDQRGRGRSAAEVEPEDVSLASDLDDLDKVRQYFQLESAAVLGHSWGTVVALEYALRHPTRVSHLILMNPAPASARQNSVFRKAYSQKLGTDMDRQRGITASPAYQEGDPTTVAARYRLHFKHALARPEDYEGLMATMRAKFMEQGSEGIVKAQAIEDRLMRDTYEVNDYDLLPRLRGMRVPTLIISGDEEFVPPEICEDIARAIPGAQLLVLENCGHFAYLECPAEVRNALVDFLRSA